MAAILIVEDHALSRQVLKTLFGYMGHQVLEAADGAAGLALARSHSPDLVITDIVMPTMNGVEFIKRLRAEPALEKTPAIFYTATYRMTEALRMGKECGVRVIPKPADPNFILNTVNEILGVGNTSVPAPPSTEELKTSIRHSEAFESDGLKLATLMDLSFHLVSLRHPRQLMENFCRACQDILNSRYACLTIVGIDGKIRYYVTSNADGTSGLGALFSETEITERVINQRSVLRCCGPAVAGQRPVDNVFLLAVPIATTRRLYGWIGLAGKLKGGPFSAGDEEIAVGLAAQVALAYENILLMEQLRQRTAHLEATNRELETFSYTVAHDLRGPLRRIDSFIWALVTKHLGKMDNLAQDLLQRTRKTAAHMSQLLDGLLSLSHLSKYEILHESVNLTNLAHEVAQGLHETAFGRRCTFSIDEGITAEGDAKLLRVVLENLFGNACKFSRKNPQAEIVFGQKEDDDKVIYFIKDNGVGFNMAYAGKLFRPFERMHTEKEFPGTGIGLATVQRIIHRHGGRIWIESEVNRGTTVYFTL